MERRGLERYNIRSLDEAETIKMREKIITLRGRVFDIDYDDYVIDPKADKRWGVSHFFDEKNPSSDQLNSLSDEEIRRITHEDAMRYRHPERLNELSSEQLLGNRGFVTLATINNTIAGASLGSKSTVREVFDWNWASGTPYAKRHPVALERNPNHFISLVETRSKGGLNWESELIFWESLFTAQEHRGIGLAPRIAKNFFNSLRESIDGRSDIMIVGDMVEGSDSERLFMESGGFKIENFLNNHKKGGGEVIVFANLRQMIRNVLSK